jgi:hypothetical protein
MSKSIKKTVTHIQRLINECWDAQALLSDDDPDYIALDNQIKAYQDVHVFLTDGEFDGEFSPDESESGLEPGEVLVKHEDADEDDEDDED